MEISQKSGSEFFSATDLVRAGNKWRLNEKMMPFDMSNWLQNKSTKEFIKELEKKFGKVKISGRGRGTNTWVHPLLFIDMALAISPKLKIETYQWLFDNLIKNRNDSGDSYKKMCGSLYNHSCNKREFSKEVQNVAKQIQYAIGCSDWQRASEKQLKQREQMHEAISIMSDVLRDNSQAVRLGIQRYS